MASLALLGVTAIWGWTFVLVKDALQEIGPFWFLTLRFSLAFLASAPLLFRHRAKAGWALGAMLGLPLFGGYFFQTWGLEYTTVQKSGLISGLAVVLVPVLAWAFGERPGSRVWAMVGLAGAGVVLLTLGGGVDLGPTGFGDLLTFISSVSFALYLVLLEGQAPQVPVGGLLPAQMLTVALLSSLGALGLEALPWPLSPQVWLALLVTGILASSLAYYVVGWAEARASASEVAVILSMEPVFATFFGWALEGEALRPLGILGAALILGSILLGSLTGRGIDRKDDS